MFPDPATAKPFVDARARPGPSAPGLAPDAGRVLVTTDVPTQKTAWTKARQDVLTLTRAAGYGALPLPASLSPWAWRRFFSALAGKVGAGGSVLVEYPFEQRRRLYPLFSFCRLKGIRLHGLIHDLHALRLGAPAGREMAVLRLFDGLVSHNAVMSNWLRAQGYGGVLADLQLFDYLLAPGQLQRNWHEDEFGPGPLKVVCAGNLSYPKARYVYDPLLGQLPGVELSLFGAFFEPDRMPPSGVHYKGVFEPDSPVLDGRYHFGLVWDGDSAERCEGGYGRYMRHNNPHKVSLYAALGLPVVVWDESAVAGFVLSQGVGVTVGSLRELPDITRRLRQADFQRMVAQMNRLRRQVVSGHFLRQALRVLEEAG